MVPYAVIGLVLCGLALRLPAIAEFAAIVLAVFMLVIFVGLLEERGGLLAHDQMAPLRHLPISARTFFACHLTRQLGRTGWLATLIAAPTVLQTVVREGAAPATGLAIAAALSSLFVAFFLAALFLSSRASKAGPTWIASGRLFIGLVLLVAVIAGPLFVANLNAEPAVAVLGPALAFPPLWFAAFVDAANGRGGTGVLLFAGIALAGTLLAYAAMGRAWDRVQRTFADGATPRQLESKSLAAALRRWLPPEARACATLFRAHLGRDANFRLRLAAGLPLSLMLLSLSVMDFLQVEGLAARLDDFMSVGLIHVAAVVVPLAWLDAASRSDAFRAAWIFAATPTDIGKVAFWTGSAVGLLALPFLTLVGIVLFFVLGGGWQAVGHAVNLVLAVNVVVICAVAISPRTPFSVPAAKPNSASSQKFARDVAAGSLAFFLLPVLLSAAASRLWSAVCLAATLIVVVAPLKRMVVRRTAALGDLRR